MKNQGDPDFEDAFIREIKEDIKNDNLKKLWDKYGLYIIIFVIVVLTATVSFESIKAWRLKGAQELSNTYAYALNLQNQGKYDESLKILEKIRENNKGIYSDIAEIQISNIMFEQGKNPEGIAILEKIIKDKSANPQIKDVSTIKLASYKLDTAPTDELKAMLNPLVAANGSWSNIAKELLAMLAIRDANIKEARAIYSEIANSENVSESLKIRAQDMLSVLDSAQK